MLKKSFKKIVGICLAMLMAFSTLTAFGAGYGSLALEKTSAGADLFNGTGSFETGVKDVGTTGNSNLSEGWQVYQGVSTTADFCLSNAQSKDGSYSFYTKGSKYIQPDPGIVKNIFDTNGFNGKYVIKAQLYGGAASTSMSVDLRVADAKNIDESKIKSYAADTTQGYSDKSNNNKWTSVVSPLSDKVADGLITAEQLAAIKSSVGKQITVHAVKSAKATKDAWSSFELTFDGTNSEAWEVWYSYYGYGYKDGKFYDKEGTAYDKYPATIDTKKAIYFNDKYVFENGGIGSLATNSVFTNLLIQGSNQAYIDCITMTFEPAGGDKTSSFAGETMPVNTRVYNNLAEETIAVLITAIYDSDNTLKGVTAKDFTIGANETDKIVSDTIDVPSDLEDGYSIKTYAWKNLENDISPLATALDRESNDGNLLENGGFEILPKTATGSAGEDSIAKNWRFWDGKDNGGYVAQAGGASGSAYCVKAMGGSTYMEYSVDKITDILKQNGVKGTYTLTLDYKCDTQLTNKFMSFIMRVTSAYPQKSQSSSVRLENTNGGWKKATFTMPSDKYEYWTAGASSATKVTKDEIYALDVSALGGRLALKSDIDVLIDNISLTFTPDN